MYNRRSIITIKFLLLCKHYPIKLTYLIKGFIITAQIFYGGLCTLQFVNTLLYNFKTFFDSAFYQVTFKINQKKTREHQLNFLLMEFLIYI